MFNGNPSPTYELRVKASNLEPALSQVFNVEDSDAGSVAYITVDFRDRFYNQLDIVLNDITFSSNDSPECAANTDDDTCVEIYFLWCENDDVCSGNITEALLVNDNNYVSILQPPASVIETTPNVANGVLLLVPP